MSLSENLKKLEADTTQLVGTTILCVEQTKAVVADLEAVGIDAMAFFTHAVKGDEHACRAMAAAAQDKSTEAVNWEGVFSFISEMLKKAPETIQAILAIIAVISKK